MTRSLVSRRRVAPGRASSTGSSKCLTSTVPLGNVHSPSGRKPIFESREEESFGKDIQRDLAAPSDQNDTLMSYGTNPSAGAKSRVFLKAPVCESRSGNSPVSPGGIDR